MTYATANSGRPRGSTGGPGSAGAFGSFGSGGGAGARGRVRVRGRRGLHQRHLALELVEHRQHALAPLYVEGAEGRKRRRWRSGPGRDARDGVGAGIDRRAERRGRARNGGRGAESRRENSHVRHVVGDPRPDVALSSPPRVAPPPRARALRFGTSQGPPGASPSRLSRFWQLESQAITARRAIFGAHDYESSRQATTTRSGTERATRESRARAARDEPRGAPRISHSARLVSSASVDSRVEGSFASRSSPAGSVVVGRRPLTLAGTLMPPMSGSAPRAVDRIDPRDARAETLAETFAEAAPSSTRRSRAIPPPADADADDDGPMGRRGATVRRRTTTRDPARLGDSARARFVFALTFPPPQPRTSDLVPEDIAAIKSAYCAASPRSPPPAASSAASRPPETRVRVARFDAAPAPLATDRGSVSARVARPDHPIQTIGDAVVNALAIKRLEEARRTHGERMEARMRTPLGFDPRATP